MTKWETIPAFDAYSVSDAGRVRNDATDKILAIRRNRGGVCFVGLSKDGVQKQRGLAILVAQAFVMDTTPKQRSDARTPIHLDGNQSNNEASNLMWRPPWFAQRYMRQFEDERIQSHPIVDTRTGISYDTLWLAATKFGLLEREINSAIHRRTYVWPTFQEFRFVPQ